MAFNLKINVLKKCLMLTLQIFRRIYSSIIHITYVKRIMIFIFIFLLFIIKNLAQFSSIFRMSMLQLFY
jgi:hypothetical protein